MKDDPNRIRELRNGLKLSQQALGDMIGCSKMTISDLERGGMELTLDYMRRIARALNVMPADLLPITDNPWAMDARERSYFVRYAQADEEQRAILDRVTEAVAPFKQRDSDAA